MRLIAPVLICLALVACKPATTPQEREAIQTVLIDTSNAVDRANVVTKRGRNYWTNFVSAKYVEGLHGVHTAGCPEEFRLTFLAYVQTVERRSESARKLTGAVETGLGAAKGNADAVEDGLKRQDSVDTAEAWRKVKMSALEYGVGN